jgi:CRISPR-associated endonuclease/helicase Cas3
MNACFQRRVIAMTEPKKKSYGRAKTGIELTPEVLDRMSAEAEAGLDPTTLRRRPGRPTMGSAPADALPVRLDPDSGEQSMSVPRRTTPPLQKS